MNRQEAVELIQELMTSGSGDEFVKAVQDNITSLDQTFFDVLSDIIESAKADGRDDIVQYLSELKDLLTSIMNELFGQIGTGNKLVNLFLSLTKQVDEGKISLEEAISIVRSEEIITKLDDEIVDVLDDIGGKIKYQSTPFAYILAILNYEVAKTVDNPKSIIYCANTLGIISNMLEAFRESIKFFTEVLKLSQESGERQSEGAALGNLGGAYSALGEYGKAIECCEKALAIATEIGNRGEEGINLGNLGNVYRELEEYRKAIEYYKRAVAIATEIGDREGEGRHLGNLGNVYSDLGKDGWAIEYYEKALAIAAETGNRRNEATWLGNLGVVYSDLGEYRKAIEYYERGLAITREIGDLTNELEWLKGLGDIYEAMGEHKKAEEYYQQASKIASED